MISRPVVNAGLLSDHQVEAVGHQAVSQDVDG